MFQTVEEIIECCIMSGCAIWGHYYIEYKRPTLFDQTSKTTLYKYAHPDSMSSNHCIEVGSLEELAYDLLRINDPIETIWGCF